MESYWQTLKKEKMLSLFLATVLLFVTVLVFSLNMSLAVFSVLLFISALVFRHSFHKGLVFFLTLIILFPPFQFLSAGNDSQILLIVILALIGLLNLFISKYKFKFLPLFKYWLVLEILVFLSFVFTKISNAGDFSSIYYSDFLKLFLLFLLFPIVILAFQFFFQTEKRIEKFVLFIITLGFFKSLLLISTQLLIHKSFPFNNNSLNSLIVLGVAIPFTLGFWYLHKNDFLENTREGKSAEWELELIEKAPFLKKSLFNHFSKLNHSKNFFLAVFTVQSLALFLSQQFYFFFIIAIAILIMGILLREKAFLQIAVWSILFFSLKFYFSDANTIAQIKEILINLSHLNKKFFFPVLGSNPSGFSTDSFNSSFLFLYYHLGFFGLLIFLGALGQYFWEIRTAYLQSEGVKRVYLVVILSIFIIFLILATIQNVYFAWPASLLFWLFYGLLQNLQIRKIEYRLTESIINNN